MDLLKNMMLIILIVFEGEYKKGEKNGKGILSRKYRIIFDSDNLNGKK